jgi:hypothetical protein
MARGTTRRLWCSFSLGFVFSRLLNLRTRGAQSELFVPGEEAIRNAKKYALAPTDPTFAAEFLQYKPRNNSIYFPSNKLA